jgi:hypothetical protein
MFKLAETLRRLFTVGSLLLGVWMICTPGPEMLVIEHQDFEKSFKNDPYFRSKDTTLESFKQDRLKDRTVDVDPADWEEVFEAVRSGQLGKANQIMRGGHVYWRSDVEAYDPAWPDFIYLHPTGTDDYYSLMRAHPLDIYGIDRSKVYPNRDTGLLLVAAAFLLYLLIPRAKRLPERIYYSKAASVVIPDLMGLLGSAFFFALPILVISHNSPGSLPWDTDGGWWILTAVLWTMSALFLSILFIANHYATLWFEITESALLINRGSTTTAYRWTDMASCQTYVGTLGRKLGLLLILFGRSPGAVGQGLLVATNEAVGVEIEFRNNKSLKIMANHLPRFSQIIGALESHGIAGAGNILYD